MPGTRKLGRATASRTAMQAMSPFLLENGKIETTVTRAKEVKAMTSNHYKTKYGMTFIPSVRFILMLQRKPSLRKSLMILLQNTKRETAVTAASSRSITSPR